MRCDCGAIELLQNTNTGAPVRIENFTLSGGLKWVTHRLSPNRCDGVYIRAYPQ